MAFLEFACRNLEKRNITDSEETLCPQSWEGTEVKGMTEDYSCYYDSSKTKLS